MHVGLKIIISIIYYLLVLFLMQRYGKFLKLPNKIHIKYYFRCIFNVLLRFKYSIPYLSVIVRSEVSILTSSIDGASRGSDGKNTAAILTDRRQRENKCGRFRDKHLKFQSYFKEIMLPAVVSLHACRSAGRGRGRLSGFPCMM